GDDREYAVVGAVVELVEGLDVVQVGGVQVGHRPDGGVMVGVPLGVGQTQDPLQGRAVGLVVVTLTALVLDHVALVVQDLLSHALTQGRQTVRLQPQDEVEGVCGNRLVIVRAIGGGGGVDVATQTLHQVEVFRLGDVAAALEHQVLEQVGEPGPSRDLVPGPDVVPQVHRGHLPGGSRCGHQTQPVVKREPTDLFRRSVGGHQCCTPIRAAAMFVSWTTTTLRPSATDRIRDRQIGVENSIPVAGGVHGLGDLVIDLVVLRVDRPHVQEDVTDRQEPHAYLEGVVVDARDVPHRVVRLEFVGVLHEAGIGEFCVGDPDVAGRGRVEAATTVGVTGPAVVVEERVPLGRPVVRVSVGGLRYQLDGPVGAVGLSGRGHAQAVVLLLCFPSIGDLDAHTADLHCVEALVFVWSHRGHHATLAALQLDLLGLATGTGSEQYRRRGGPHSHTRAPTTPHDPARRAHHPCTPLQNTTRP